MLTHSQMRRAHTTHTHSTLTHMHSVSLANIHIHLIYTHTYLKHTHSHTECTVHMFCLLIGCLWLLGESCGYNISVCCRTQSFEDGVYCLHSVTAVINKYTRCMLSNFYDQPEILCSVLLWEMATPPDFVGCGWLGTAEKRSLWLG